MRAIAIVVTLHRPYAHDCAEAVARLAREAGLEVAVVGNEGQALGLPCDGVPDNVDLIVTVGGDGTLLRGVRVGAPLDLPILGINTGRLGFLTELETSEEDFASLRNVFAGKFEIEERVGLQCSINGEGSHFALNDVVVRRGAQARLAPFGLSLNGELIAHLPSDGVVIATPTGSTAYFLSAGGPIIAPTVDAFGVAALLPHTFFARPLIVPTSSTIGVTCDSEIVQANLETDGTVVADLSSGDHVTVQRAPRPVKFVRARPSGFFNRLEQKLQWGVPIKRA